MTRTELRIGAVSRNYFNMPLWIAERRGFFAAEGIRAAITLSEPIDAVTNDLREGRLDLALGVSEHVVLDARAGGRLGIVGGNVNRLPFSLIARPGIARLADLEGCRIGVSSLDAGSSSLVMHMLKEAGLSHPRDYTLLAVGPILARWEKLQAGEIDAGLQGAPLNHIAIDAGFSDLGSPRDRFPDFQFTSINVDRDWARSNEALVVASLRAFCRAHRWFYENRDGASAIAAEFTGIAPTYAARAWDEYTQAEIFPRDGAASAAGVATLIAVSDAIRQTHGKSEGAAYIDGRYLAAARRAL